MAFPFFILILTCMGIFCKIFYDYGMLVMEVVFMDIRTSIVQKIVMALTGKAKDSIINLVQDALTMELNSYEVTERCTEVTVRDDSAEGILKKFLVTKKVEGIADSTLQRYADINLALLRYLDKPLGEISTYDIRYYLSLRRQIGKVGNQTLDGMRRCYSSFCKA